MGKTNWQVKSLSDFVSISKGKKLNSLVDKETSNSKRFIQIDDLRNSDDLKFTEDKSGVLVNEKDVLIAWDGANAGTVGFGLDGFIGSTIARLEILNDSISTIYFGWYLRTKSKYLRDNSSGATIPHINKSILESLKIPLPPLPIQKQITEILEQADKARQKRKGANKLTDEFLQSVFIEMFGDPVRNPKRWREESLGNLCSKITDGTHVTPKYQNEGIKFISAKNIKNSRIDWSDIKYISEKEHSALYRRCNPNKGDILLTKSGSLGVAAFVNVDFEFSLFESLALLKFDSSVIDGLFLTYLINNESFKSFNQKSIRGISIRHLHLNEISKFKVMVPSIFIQQQFAEIVNKTETLKEKQKQSEQELENLFQSLMQKAFKGELV